MTDFVIAFLQVLFGCGVGVCLSLLLRLPPLCKPSDWCAEGDEIANKAKQ